MPENTRTRNLDSIMFSYVQVFTHALGNVARCTHLLIRPGIQQKELAILIQQSKPLVKESVL